MKIVADDGMEYKYTVDPNPHVGYSIATIPIMETINSNLRKITKNDIIEIKITKKELNDLYCCNMNIEDLPGKYYDKNGFVYYSIDDQIYRFHLKIKYFSAGYKEYESKINSA